VSANRVLLVANASEELTGILRSASWEVRPAQSFHEALTELSAQSVPVVICERALADGDWKDLLGKTPRLIVTSVSRMKYCGRKCSTWADTTCWRSPLMSWKSGG
jgi:hypothetical protein